MLLLTGSLSGSSHRSPALTHFILQPRTWEASSYVWTREQGSLSISAHSVPVQTWKWVGGRGGPPKVRKSHHVAEP